MDQSAIISDSNGKELPEDWHQQLTKYTSFLSKNGWDGEDLAQEAAAKAFQHYAVEQITMSLLKKMAYHTWVDLVRKRSREAIVEQLPISKELHDHNNCEKQMESVEDLLGKVTPKQAVVLLLKESFHYQVKEIAEVMNTSEEAVKAVLFRARNRIAKRTEISKPVIEPNTSAELYPLIYEALQRNDPSRLLEKIPKLDVFAGLHSLSTNHSLSLMAA
ncbi:RNA polymerase subunit sigma [Halobacillus salinarum]|uniref:RNA polymerase subunit sigma n=1 Tax=Halobacillus salinarum TaxID=2932257 RepID=A0ABY4EMM9_9BACI|nr:sigma factor-like helix-turn-helix DNA-binding protein [Halobacillus salinarum]UOQ45645.1 RNA polymerase subunit sigma [Halobacillus salinarum]